MSPKPNSVKQVYEAISDNFSASRAYIWPDLKPLLDQVKTNSSVLDVGCGNGRLLLGLPEKIRYTGLDFSTALLQKATEKYPQAQFIETDITQPDVWKHLPQYDYIFCVAVIHHSATREEQLFVLRQIKKHLKPKGKCLITAWNLWQPKYLKYHFDLRSKIQDLHYLYVPFQNQPRFHFAHTKPYLKKLLQNTNLDLVIEKSSRNYLIHNF